MRKPLIRTYSAFSISYLILTAASKWPLTSLIRLTVRGRPSVMATEERWRLRS